jgi:hypothetical protein
MIAAPSMPSSKRFVQRPASNEVWNLVLNREPLGFAGGDLDLYRYCGNSPTDGTDPSGTEDLKLPSAPQYTGANTGSPNAGKLQLPSSNTVFTDENGLEFIEDSLTKILTLNA